MRDLAQSKREHIEPIVNAYSLSYDLELKASITHGLCPPIPHPVWGWFTYKLSLRCRKRGWFRLVDMGTVDPMAISRGLDLLLNELTFEIQREAA